MKTTIFIGISLLLSLSLFAEEQTPQDTIQLNEFKADKGDVSIETGFIPFSDANVLTGAIKVRYFIRRDLALRLPLQVGFNSNSTTYSYETNFQEYTRYNETNRTFFAFNPGIEKHLKGSKRLSPYFGGELVFAMNLMSSKYKTETVINGTTTVIEDIKLNGAYYNGGSNELTAGSTWTLGGRFVLGTDIYLTKAFYLGIEASCGASYTQTLPIKADGIDLDQYAQYKNKSVNFNLSYNSALRLGVNF